jgi:hypothetical protein
MHHELSTGNADLQWLRERTTVEDLSPNGSGFGLNYPTGSKGHDPGPFPYPD